jgi:antitoxin HicB
MIYHFKVHKEKNGYWCQCIEINSCRTQGESMQELKINAHEALNLLLDEPHNSKIIFPLPKKVKALPSVFEVRVDPNIAFAFLMRRTRLKKGLSQMEMKKVLDIKSLFTYQKLEKAKSANPTLKTLEFIKQRLSDFPIQYLF